MSTGEQGKQQPTIEDLLGTLNIESLKRYHDSVGGSFKRMRDYIDGISTSGVPTDIKLLINTYQDMADNFYQQFELTLLDEIKIYNDVNLNVKNAIDKINDLPSSGNEELQTTIPFLQKTRDEAIKEQKSLIDNFPTQLQIALDKLRQEWQRLNIVAISIKALAKDEKLMKTLEFVVEAAKISVGISDQIAIVPGDAFSLQFYSYLKNFSVLTVPIYSVQAPEEWSIFWHELAGAKARRLRYDTVNEIKTTREKLTLFHQYFQYKKSKNEEQDLLKIVARNNRYEDAEKYPPQDEDVQNLKKLRNNFCQRYLNDVFSGALPDLSDLGSMEHQFERMLAKLPEENRIQLYEEIKEKGWCVDWLKELFEDAWSVLAIREPFLDFFNDILARHVATDGIHPPMLVRLEVAIEMLNLMKSEGDKQEQEKSVERIAAEQILKFVSLMMAASYETPQIINGDYDQDKESLAYNDKRRQLPDIVGTGIGYYIVQRSLKKDQPSQDVNYDDFINAYTSKDAQEFASTLINSTTAVVSYAEMLKDKDYKQLLALSFFDVDFAAVGLVTINLEGHQPFSYLGALPADTIGTVKYKVGDAPHTTNPSTWNEFFGGHIKL